MHQPARGLFLCLICSFLLAAFMSNAAWAAPPQTISYQAKVCDSEGQPVSGVMALTFALYGSAQSFIPLWTESHGAVVAVDGVVSVVLGSITPLTLDFDQTYYLGITSGSGMGTDTEMSPRTALTSVPYALRAINADKAATADAVDSGAAVTSVNAATDGMTIIGTAPISVATDGQSITISSSAMTGVNAATGALTIAGSSPISVATNGQTITISTAAVASVTAGAGLSDSGTATDPVLAVEFAGEGSSDSASRSDHVHDDRYYQKAQLQTAGQAAVSWDNLADVPDMEGPYAKVITVAKHGGRYTSIQAAMDSVSGSSEVNPYLVWVGPGEYEEAVTIPDYTYLRGAGRGLTIISAPTGAEAALTLGEGAQVSDLTIKNSQADMDTYGIKAAGAAGVFDQVDVTVTATGDVDVFGLYINGHGGPRLRDMTFTVSKSDATGTVHGLSGINCSLDADRVSLESSGGAQGYAVELVADNTASDYTAYFNNCTLSAQGASSYNAALVVSESGSVGGKAVVQVRKSRIVSAGSAISTGTAYCQALLAGSELQGEVGGDGVETCAACFGGDFAALGTDCLTP